MGNHLSKFLTILTIVAIIATAVALVYYSTNSTEAFTEFYILGSDGKADNYPTDLMLGKSGKVVVGVVNKENVFHNYRLEVLVNGEKVTEAGPFVLQHNDKWENTIEFTPRQAGDNQEVEFLIYKDDDTQPYIQPLRLWINVETSA